MRPHADIVAKCKANNRKAQKALYQKYSSLFFSICLRYMKNATDAEDLLVESFYRIFSKINQYSGNGSFEGWMKRIVVNECLMKLRKKNSMSLYVEIDQAYNLKEDEQIFSDINYNEIVGLLGELPAGYRTVFNLYVIEGYKHREIAEILGISINTSKSQLILAKKRLAAVYKKKQLSTLDSQTKFDQIG